MRYVGLQLRLGEVDEVRQICCHGISRPRPLANGRGRDVSTSHPRHCRQHLLVVLILQTTTSPLSGAHSRPSQWPQLCVPAFSDKLARSPPARSACCPPSRAPPSTARSPSSCDQRSSAPPSQSLHALPPSMLLSATRSCPHCPRRLLGQPTTRPRYPTQTTPMAATTGVLRGMTSPIYELGGTSGTWRTWYTGRA
jgi:hypothetical protein